MRTKLPIQENQQSIGGFSGQTQTGFSLSFDSKAKDAAFSICPLQIITYNFIYC